MQPRPHQVKAAAELWGVLVKYKYAYLNAPPRVGKTLTSILAMEKSKRVQSVLVICPKPAIKGWRVLLDDEELLADGHITKQYTVINYEALGSFKTRTTSKSGKPIKPVSELHLKINPDDYEAVIIDESHRLGKLGKPSQRYKIVKAVVEGKPHLHLSGTSFVESPNQIYYQMAFEPYSPFKHKSFYDYFYGYTLEREYEIINGEKIYTGKERVKRG